MKRAPAPFGLTDGSKTNVAVQRPTVNIKEAENLGEQATAASQAKPEPVRFSKHGTFGPSPVHPVENMWSE